MDTTINQLYKDGHPDIAYRVIEICIDQNVNLVDRAAYNDSLIKLFSWAQTKEGSTIWSRVNAGYYDEFYKYYSKNPNSTIKKRIGEYRKYYKSNKFPNANITKEMMERDGFEDLLQYTQITI